MVEPQRLIAMSLGKIHACRGQRGGPSLHKSLMVSAVLHKARNIMMMQARIAHMEQQRLLERQQSVNDNKAEIAAIVEPPRPGTPLPTLPASSVEDPAKKQRQENELPTCNKENSPPEVNKTETSDKMEYRDNLKRRLDDSENVPAKRSRTENEKCEETQTQSSQPQNECAQQISSLVQRFNSGLNGLFASQKASVPLQDSQGHNDVVSNCCATQITKDVVASFAEQLRPVIALTV